MQENWENKRREWVKQSNQAIAETNWHDPNALERRDSDLFCPLFTELDCLPQNELHWVEVLVGSAIVERILSPLWKDIYTSGSSKTGVAKTHTSTGAGTSTTLRITIRFGFSQETLFTKGECPSTHRVGPLSLSGSLFLG